MVPSSQPECSFRPRPRAIPLTCERDGAHCLVAAHAARYGNNCICSDHCKDDDECDAQIKGDVDAFVKYNFDSWKLDGCGGEKNLVLFNK